MFEENLMRYLDSIPVGRRRRLRTMTALPAGRIRLGDRELVNFASNDYLGLAARLTEQTAPVSGCASRLICGGHPLFEQIESRIAELKGTESALLFGTGFQANASVLETLLATDLHGTGDGRKREPRVQVFADRLIHASFHSGLRGAGVRQIRYRHGDLDHLSELLKKHRREDWPALIVTESVFSMDGDRTNVARLRELASDAGAWLYVDEAHATGVLGIRGMGLMADPGNPSPLRNREVVIGTFSKAFACFGAYVACSQAVRDYLVNRCPGVIYSTALPPLLLTRIEESLDRVIGMEAERESLAARARQLRAGVHALGLATGSSDTQIVPVHLGSDDQVMAVARALEQSGWLVGAIRPPTVPEGTARLRLSCSAAHSEDDVAGLVSQLKTCLAGVAL